MRIDIDGITSDNNIDVRIVVNGGRTWPAIYKQVHLDNNSNMSYGASVIERLDANDSVTIVIVAAGSSGTATQDVLSGLRSHWTGVLVN